MPGLTDDSTQCVRGARGLRAHAARALARALALSAPAAADGDAGHAIYTVRAAPRAQAWDALSSEPARQQYLARRIRQALEERTQALLQ